jgi:peroxiredoxin
VEERLDKKGIKNIRISRSIGQFMKLKLFLAVASISLASIAYALQPGIKLYNEPIMAPEFVLSDTDNNIHKLSDYHDKVLIINFWATWCVPCRKEIPLLKAAWKILERENVYLLGIATKDSKDAVEQFQKKNDLEFPLPIDEDGSVADQWSVIAVPVAFVIDPNGHIAMRIVGGNEWNNPELIDSIIALKTQSEK